jgi:hypothetical protein
MRKGGSKVKGGGYERAICKKLSLWITRGKRADVFWRTALSGGRATVAHMKGVDVRQAGDICSVAPEGHALCDLWYIECKHIKNLRIGSFFTTGKGELASFWRTTEKKAIEHGRWPVLIARQNHFPDLIILQGTYPNIAFRIATATIGGYAVQVHHLDAFLKGEPPITDAESKREPRVALIRRNR